MDQIPLSLSLSLSLWRLFLHTDWLVIYFEAQIITWMDIARSDLCPMTFQSEKGYSTKNPRRREREREREDCDFLGGFASLSTVVTLKIASFFAKVTIQKYNLVKFKLLHVTLNRLHVNWRNFTLEPVRDLRTFSKETCKVWKSTVKTE